MLALTCSAVSAEFRLYMNHMYVTCHWIDADSCTQQDSVMSI